MVGGKEKGFGDGVDLICDGPSHLIAYPGGAGLPGKDRGEVRKSALKRGKEGALPAAIDPLQGDQDHLPLRRFSRGIVPLCIAVAMMAPSNPSAASVSRSAGDATPPP